MPSKMPVERIGTLREGEIYLCADQDRKATEIFQIQAQGLDLTVIAKHDVNAGEYDWFRIIRANDTSRTAE